MKQISLRFFSQFLLLFLIIFLFLSLGTNSHAMIRTLPVEELICSSDYIVVAQVWSVSVIKTDPETTMSTLKNELKVIESLKGSWPEDKPVILQTFRAEYWIEDNVELPQTGLKALLFLQKSKQDIVTPVNGIQGIWPFSENKLFGMGTGISIDQVREIVRKQQQKKISGEEAEKIIWELPEVKLQADEFRKQGSRPFIRIESTPEPDAICGTPEASYTIYLGEDLDTHTVRSMTFLVDAYTGIVSVYDVVADKILSLADWRNKIEQNMPKE